MPEAEPFTAVGGRNGVLVLHGFSGNPHSMRGIAEQLASGGYSVELPLLPGHGTAVEDLISMRFSHWARAVEECYLDLGARCDSVVVVGLSMGGTLACWLAQQHPELSGVALINPLVEPPPDELLRAVGELVDSGTEVAPGIGSDIAMEGVTEYSYDGTPLKAALSLFDGVREVASKIAEIRAPVLLLSSRQDHVVPPSNGDFLVASLRTQVERVWLERSYHVATLDFDREEVEHRIVAFVSDVFAGNIQ